MEHKSSHCTFPTPGIQGSRRLMPMMLTVLALIAATLPFVLPRIPVENDTFKHLLIARVLTSYGDPVLEYSKYFELAIRPVSNSFCWAILAGLMKLVSPFDAARIYLVLVILALWFFCRKLVLELGLPDTAALVALPLSQTTHFFCGNLPFIASIAIYPAFLWVLVKHRCGIGRPIRVFLVLVVLYGFHIVGYAIACLTVVVFAVAPVVGFFKDWRRRDAGTLWGDLLAVTLTLPLLVFMVARQPGRLHVFYFSLVNHFKSLLAFTVWPLSRSAGVPLLVGVVMFFGVAMWQAVRGKTGRRFTLLWLALLFLLAVLPLQINALYPAGPRILPFAIIVAIGVINLSPRGWKIAGAAAAGVVVISSALNTKAALAVQPACEEFLAGMNSVAYGSRVLPIYEDMSLGGNVNCGPFWGIEDAYTIFRGGSNPYCFAAPFWKVGAHLLKYRSYDTAYVKKYGLDLPSSHIQTYAGVSRHYDYVLIFGSRPFVARQVSKEMLLCYSRGRLQVFGRPGKCAPGLSLGPTDSHVIQ